MQIHRTPHLRRLRNTSWPVARRSPSAFTLIEILIIVVILAILATIALGMFRSGENSARARSTATNVRSVRTLIMAHANQRDVPLTPGGYPAQISQDWFKGTGPPLHGWTGQSMVIQVVSDASNVVYPAVKVFDPTNVLATNAWYNNANGSFCALVPAQANDQNTLDLFNEVNNANATALNQTTH
jgi:type II secretory pathway pseudopilin PulG